jgi:hypothetical protein
MFSILFWEHNPYPDNYSLHKFTIIVSISKIWKETEKNDTLGIWLIMGNIINQKHKQKMFCFCHNVSFYFVSSDMNITGVMEYITRSQQPYLPPHISPYWWSGWRHRSMMTQSSPSHVVCMWDLQGWGKCRFAHVCVSCCYFIGWCTD